MSWLMRSLVGIAEGRNSEALPIVPPKEKDVDVAAIRGLYRLPDVGDVRIDVSQAGPILRVDQGPTYKMYPVGFGILYVPGKDAYVGIETSNDTSSPRLTWSSVFIKSEGLRLQR